MKRFFLLFGCGLLFFTSCAGLENPARPVYETTGGPGSGAAYYTVDGTEIFIYEYTPDLPYENTVIMLSGITGINHDTEAEVIQLLSEAKSRVLVIHPRGTGYSGGARGSIDDFSLFIDDHVEIIESEVRTGAGKPVFLFGHSMSSALALSVYERLAADTPVDGIILVNPPYKLKQSDGMSPGFFDYVKYAFYYLFAPDSPIVDMSGNPDLIKNPEEKAEAVQRKADPLIVKYFSLHMMMESQDMMNRMGQISESADVPLLLVYGTEDSIVDESGCDELFESWRHRDKTFIRIEGGPHGRRTVIEASSRITDWVMQK